MQRNASISTVLFIPFTAPIDKKDGYKNRIVEPFSIGGSFFLRPFETKT